MTTRDYFISDRRQNDISSPSPSPSKYQVIVPVLTIVTTLVIVLNVFIFIYSIDNNQPRFLAKIAPGPKGDQGPPGYCNLSMSGYLNSSDIFLRDTFIDGDIYVNYSLIFPNNGSMPINYDSRIFLDRDNDCLTINSSKVCIPGELIANINVGNVANGFIIGDNSSIISNSSGLFITNQYGGITITNISLPIYFTNDMGSIYYNDDDYLLTNDLIPYDDYNIILNFSTSTSTGTSLIGNISLVDNNINGCPSFKYTPVFNRGFYFAPTDLINNNPFLLSSCNILNRSQITTDYFGYNKKYAYALPSSTIVEKTLYLLLGYSNNLVVNASDLIQFTTNNILISNNITINDSKNYIIGNIKLSNDNATIFISPNSLINYTTIGSLLGTGYVPPPNINLNSKCLNLYPFSKNLCLNISQLIFPNNDIYIQSQNSILINASDVNIIGNLNVTGSLIFGQIDFTNISISYNALTVDTTLNVGGFINLLNPGSLITGAQTTVSLGGQTYVDNITFGGNMIINSLPSSGDSIFCTVPIFKTRDRTNNTGACVVACSDDYLCDKEVKTLYIRDGLSMFTTNNSTISKNNINVTIGSLNTNLNKFGVITYNMSIMSNITTIRSTIASQITSNKLASIVTKISDPTPSSLQPSGCIAYNFSSPPSIIVSSSPFCDNVTQYFTSNNISTFNYYNPSNSHVSSTIFIGSIDYLKTCSRPTNNSYVGAYCSNFTDTPSYELLSTNNLPFIKNNVRYYYPFLSEDSYYLVNETYNLLNYSYTIYNSSSGNIKTNYTGRYILGDNKLILSSTSLLSNVAVVTKIDDNLVLTGLIYNATGSIHPCCASSEGISNIPFQSFVYFDNITKNTNSSIRQTTALNITKINGTQNNIQSTLLPTYTDINTNILINNIPLNIPSHFLIPLTGVWTFNWNMVWSNPATFTFQNGTIINLNSAQSGTIRGCGITIVRNDSFTTTQNKMINTVIWDHQLMNNNAFFTPFTTFCHFEDNFKIGDKVFLNLFHNAPYQYLDVNFYSSSVDVKLLFK